MGFASMQRGIGSGPSRPQAAQGWSRAGAVQNKRHHAPEPTNANSRPRARRRGPALAAQLGPAGVGRLAAGPAWHGSVRQPALARRARRGLEAPGGRPRAPPPAPVSAARHGAHSSPAACSLAMRVCIFASLSLTSCSSLRTLVSRIWGRVRVVPGVDPGCDLGPADQTPGWLCSAAA